MFTASDYTVYLY